MGLTIFDVMGRELYGRFMALSIVSVAALGGGRGARALAMACARVTGVPTGSREFPEVPEPVHRHCVGRMSRMRLMLAATLAFTLASPLATLKFDAPSDWVSKAPSSSMRVAEWSLPKAAGDAEDAILTLYFFGASRVATSRRTSIDGSARWRSRTAASRKMSRRRRR